MSLTSWFHAATNTRSVQQKLQHLSISYLTGPQQIIFK